jgi:hypothetical protein
MKRKKLGEILQDRGHISAEGLHQLFEDQKGKMVRLGELILERGLVDKPALVKALEEASRVPYLIAEPGRPRKFRIPQPDRRSNPREECFPEQ